MWVKNLRSPDHREQRGGDPRKPTCWEWLGTYVRWIQGKARKKGGEVVAVTLDADGVELFPTFRSGVAPQARGMLEGSLP